MNIQPTPPPKKRGPLFWVLMGCAGLIVIGGIVVALSMFWFMRVVKQAGFDPELMKKNPTLAVAKMVAAVNPEIEIISIDENHGIIRVRDKKTGKLMTMNLADAKNGKIVFEDDKSGKLEIQAQGEGDKASVEIKGAEGSIRMGTTGQLPDWLPSYPGAQGAGTFGVNAKEGKGASYTFTTGDAPEKVASFYEEALKKAGFEVQRTVTPVAAQGSMIFMTAQDSNKERTANVSIAGKPDGAMVTLLFESKQ